ncbi:uncharacterized protein LOC117651686 [Thrips palmi]|uniref:Uncharacterized protein LOC117651686 n=1 Tax=Thrips palmi TaxID=161013 RepID=A0A6P9A216_THRPL|nr:uncharacterized protein LOC117651686 [Thrips palmi]
MARTADSAACRAPAHVLKCVALLLLCASVCSGFAVHKRHPHRGHPHHGHHRQPPVVDAAKADAPKVAASHDALLEAMRAADLSDTAWGSGDHDVGEGVPLFMKMLLKETETGDIFKEQNQPVAPPVPGSSSSNTTLASCLQPSRVSVGRAGEMVVEFPHDGGNGNGLSGWWLVLALQQGLESVADLHLAVYLSGSEERPLDVELLAQHPLPNASFVAVDVTKAVNVTAAHSWTRFMIAVKSTGSSGSSADSPATAATVLEVAGWERGPLLVGALDWGHGASADADNALRVWKDVPHDVLHPPRPRSRRRSHRRTTSATTEGPAYTSAENPLKNAAKAGLEAPQAGEQADAEEYCHLEAWTVSVADLGWDFISQPRMLDINFCVGRCPTLLLDKHFNASTNALARTGIKNTRGTEAAGNIPDAQCVPIRYRPIALLIKQRSGQVDLFTSNDLSADRCGCR